MKASKGQKVEASTEKALLRGLFPSTTRSVAFSSLGFSVPCFNKATYILSNTMIVSLSLSNVTRKQFIPSIWFDDGLYLSSKVRMSMWIEQEGS